jgi:hypothetical protein
MTGLHPGQLFHVGITAVDLEAAKQEMSRNLGVTWKGGRPRTMDLVLYGDERRVEMRIAHTVEGPPHLELIQCVPDTPWAEPSVGAHHLCYWSDDPGPVCAALEEAGSRRLLGKPGSLGGYFQSPAGLIVEVIGPALRDHLSAFARGELTRDGAAR